MPVTRGSRYQTATIIREYDEDPQTGKRSNTVLYLANDRKKFYPEDYTDLIEVTANQGDKPDMIAHQVYGDGRYWWIVAEFNDEIAINPFTIFEGGERLVLPSVELAYSEIIPLLEGQG